MIFKWCMYYVIKMIKFDVYFTFNYLNLTFFHTSSNIKGTQVVVWNFDLKDPADLKDTLHI